MSNATVLVIRHAEKPPSGDGLTPQGQARANAYAKYFEPFNDGKESFNIDALYATSDTTKSARPKLTLTPLSQATRLPIDTRFGNYDVSFLVHSLRTEQHGKHVLISWHHGHIPELINNLGVDSRIVLPNGKWPDNVFDWVIEIKYDKNGKALAAQRIQEQIQ
ncbi:MAG: flagellar basal body-associated protein FliL [Candidatus Melainabacteria bacterium]|nr:flagellar basal body-associated protein FliL [Candidatus Melainabacteria bacterium]